MKYLKKFFENNRPKHTLTQEDIEDALLELLDANYNVNKFATGYFNKNERWNVFSIVPKDGYELGYRLDISHRSLDEDDEDDYDHHKGYDTISNIEEWLNGKRKYQDLLIKSLKSAEKKLNCTIFMDWNSEFSLTMYIVPKGVEPVSVSQKESDFHDFSFFVRQRLSQTLMFNTDFFLEANDDDFEIKIRFSDNLTRGRYNTALRKLETIKTGIVGNRMINDKRFDFDQTGSYNSKQLILKFKSVLSRGF